MNARVLLSLNLVLLSFLLVLLPEREHKKGYLKPDEQIELSNRINGIDADKAARFVNENDTAIQFIDLRSPREYSEFTIPGAINIPYEKLLDKEWQGYLNPKEKTNILFANGDALSNLSLNLLEGMGYKNNQVLQGGLNNWFATVMHIEFRGGRLSARENALLENRRKARDLFCEINSLPDSLKNTFLEAKILEEDQLDGGCE